MATRASPILSQLWTLLTAQRCAGEATRAGSRARGERACTEGEGDVLCTPDDPGEAIDHPREAPVVRAQGDPAERRVNIGLEELQGAQVCLRGGGPGARIRRRRR